MQQEEEDPLTSVIPIVGTLPLIPDEEGLLDGFVPNDPSPLAELLALAREFLVDESLEAVVQW